MTIYFAILCLLAAPPSLSEAERTQLDTATDFGPANDEAALYPLLRNASQWRPGDEAGAAVPNYAALLVDPAAHRGELFLIEGEFAGRPRRLSLARPGGDEGWGDAVTEWVIRVRKNPDEVAVVYFVDPDNALAAPPRGTPVRTVARFFKVWTDRDLANQPTDFLLFVGRGPTRVAEAVPPTGLGSWAWIVILAALAGAFYVLRRYVVALRQPKPLATRRQSADQAVSDDDDPDEGLPDDPAAALDAMRQRYQGP